MKKVLMEPEEQSTINTNTNQSNEFIAVDTDNSINTQNEILVRLNILIDNLSKRKTNFFYRMIKH